MISYHQVNKLLLKRNVFNQLFRHSHEHSPARLFPLKSRKLLKVQGTDASVFLQGLITNDMRHFEEGSKSMYAMFLNNKGRVLYDTLIHQGKTSDSFILECDQDVLPMLQRHLKIFKLKRKVEIEDINNNFQLFALVSNSSDAIDTSGGQDNNLHIYKDPRLSDLGFRVLTTMDIDASEVADRIAKNVSVDNGEAYNYLRYKLGVSEGASDLPPGTCFPLEVNCDYLHGVSFHKGCYIGQEVTARVHHTGVVRKRIMPLKFSQNIEEDLAKDTTVTVSDKPKSNLGKLKGFVRDYGIGLVRVKDVLDAKVVNIGKYSAEVIKPGWWPVEAPKEKVIKVEQE